MEQVFAPWRIDWVERTDRNEEFEDCVFCEIPDREADREWGLLARGEHAYALLNNYPYNPGHTMVIPYDHGGDYRALDDESLLGKERLLGRVLDAMEAGLAPDGYNVGYNLGGGPAGGSIDDHVHAHVVPRWAGDTNFMPVVSDTTVIVEAVAETYDRLHEAMADQEGVTAEGDGAVRVT
jgi:ATP adenylyltransferase